MAAAPSPPPIHPIAAHRQEIRAARERMSALGADVRWEDGGWDDGALVAAALRSGAVMQLANRSPGRVQLERLPWGAMSPARIRRLMRAVPRSPDGRLLAMEIMRAPGLRGAAVAALVESGAIEALQHPACPWPLVERALETRGDARRFAARHPSLPLGWVRRLLGEDPTLASCVATNHGATGSRQAALMAALRRDPDGVRVRQTMEALAEDGTPDRPAVEQMYRWYGAGGATTLALGNERVTDSALEWVWREAPELRGMAARPLVERGLTSGATPERIARARLALDDLARSAPGWALMLIEAAEPEGRGWLTAADLAPLLVAPRREVRLGAARLVGSLRRGEVGRRR